MFPNLKLKIQSVGRFLSNMVMPNIGAFIAWGFITALFIPTGWLPNETLGTLVSPMVKFLLPLLIGYTGGRLVAGERGGVVGAITTMGVIVGTQNPMFLGAMIAGPLGGLTIKQFDRLIDGKIKSGFEMLVNNFSAGIIGMILAIISFWVIGPVVAKLTAILTSGVGVLVAGGLLPLTSIIVEPAKILFLNNAINHGVFTPLGVQQVIENGKSIFFLIEANPGPGLGLLLAYLFFGKGMAKSSASGATIIHFFGGIHEIYFPYVLMNPRLILAVILGGMTGIFTLTLFNAGLTAPASPGSIIAVLGMAKGSYIGVITSVIAATVVSFIVSAIILKSTATTKDDNALANATTRMHDMKNSKRSVITNINEDIDLSKVRKIIVACDAGMGSSAMGAGVLRKKVQDANLSNVHVENMAINNLPQDVDIVITHIDLTHRAKQYAPNAYHISLNNFLDSRLYSDLVVKLQEKGSPNKELNRANQTQTAPTGELFQLSEKNIFLNLQAENKTQAIRYAGEQLVKLGYTTEAYIDAMLAREAITPTYLGESIAVPHGTIKAKELVLHTGIVICQYPQGVLFGSQSSDIAHLVIGIAAKNSEHIQVIAQLTHALDDEKMIERLVNTRSIQEVLTLLQVK